MKVNDLDELKQLLQEIEDACSKNGMDIYDMKISLSSTYEGLWIPQTITFTAKRKYGV